MRRPTSLSAAEQAAPAAACGRPRAGGRGAWILLAALAYGVLTLAFLRPSPAALGDALAPDLGDPLFNLWVLDQTADEWADGPPFDFGAPIFHPLPRALTFSDYLPGPALVTVAVRALGGPDAAGYNLLLLGSFLLAGTTAHAVFRRSGLSTAASFTGGAIFAFAPYAGTSSTTSRCSSWASCRWCSGCGIACSPPAGRGTPPASSPPTPCTSPEGATSR